MPSKQAYYVSGNTADGFVNFLSTNVEDFHHVIILNHPSATLKTKVIQQIINKYESESDLEVLLSPLGSEFLDGVIIRGHSFAVVVDTIATPDLNGAIEVDLGLFLARSEESYPDKQEKIKQLTEESYTNFETGLKIHDDLEKVYINEMDFEKANEIAEEFITKLLNSKEKQNRKANIYHRLFGTNTKDGVVNEVPEILKTLSTCYFVKGRAGTGKSTFMKKIMSACHDYGYDIELYHCSFDPSSIDMVLVRELDFCIFDSTDPHEFFPSEDGHSIIDLYEEAVTPGTDEKYATEIDALNTNYKSFMKKGIVNLKEAGKFHEEVEMQYHFEEHDVSKIVTFILGKIIQ
ncbi:hypothetical protein [Ornithinibacillus halophilus]|uniref:Uncharacterized protein n=1 Tax=Ornithinibacillus halophilus TaxID=930117 RepID=A0A1M5FEF6_9BACI|nr:hypothetical protein [Ornithinibacillus halophilus]SHF89819.1 hypothetical protein SAMN05216225_100851 [Ornithinibacillus halophilus]